VKTQEATEEWRKVQGRQKLNKQGEGGATNLYIILKGRHKGGGGEYLANLTFWCRNYFFLILAHPVYKK